MVEVRVFILSLAQVLIDGFIVRPFSMRSPLHARQIVGTMMKMWMMEAREEKTLNFINAHTVAEPPPPWPSKFGVCALHGTQMQE
jgi:hypothetical protein